MPGRGRVFELHVRIFCQPLLGVDFECRLWVAFWVIQVELAGRQLSFYSPTHLLGGLASQAGTVMNGDNIVNRYFHPALEKANLRRFRLHDLRHTYGSLLIQDGASLAYVRDQMGHYSIQVTVDTYGHLIPGANVSWIDRLDSRPTSAGPTPQTQPDAESSPPLHAEDAVQTRVIRPN